MQALHENRICYRLIIYAVLLSGFASHVLGQADSAVIEPNTNDGPHVFLQYDSSATVFYYCDGDIESRTFSLEDTLRFTGFCDDTENEYIIPPTPPKPGPSGFTDITKFVAVSDIHGDYESLVEILRAATVIGDNLHWTWDTGLLIIDGDVFDRGPAVTECLWLIYRLEQEAAAAGGAVIFLLGNHELMVLRGDLRYLHERYTTGIVKTSRIAYDDLYGPETVLGQWLRTKHTVARVNRTLFVHGGLLPDMFQNGQSLDNINDAVRNGLDYSSLRLRFSESVRGLFGSFGPLWFRGLTRGIEDRYEPSTTPQVDSILRYCNVDEIVVGHSQQDSIVTYHDGKVIAIDIVVEEMGGQRALLWDDGQFYRVTPSGARTPLKK